MGEGLSQGRGTLLRLQTRVKPQIEDEDGVVRCRRSDWGLRSG